MEDEKKEIDVAGEKSEKRDSGFCGHHHCACSGHFMLRAFIKIIIILAIFSIGVSVGSHLNRENYGHFNNYRSFRYGNFEPGNFEGGAMRGGRTMMQGRGEFQSETFASPMQGNVTYTSAQAVPACGFQGVELIQGSGFQMMNQGAIQAGVSVPTRMMPTVVSPTTTIKVK
ncbi:MAG: hypothetical protein WCK59_02655 [Candidatus Falkowbacteria bacterium]